MKNMYREVFLSSDPRIINQNPETLKFQPMSWKMWDSVHGNVSDNICMQIVMEIDIFRETKAIDSTR
jgi:hypothetical protein